MLGRLFGAKGFDELKTEADALYAAGRWGEAKLAYDRLEDRAAKREQALAQLAQSRAAACCDHIADARVAEAERLAQDGHLDLAREEVGHALETARSEEALARVRAAQARIEQRDAVEQAAQPAELSEDDAILLIASTWEPLQAQELEGYGDALLRAALATEQGDGKAALALLEPLLQQAKEPSYLWLEVGRARLVSGDVAGGEEALRTFLTRIGPEEGGAARLSAHQELARLAHERGDQDAAVAELEACAEALTDDPRPYLGLGNYLRLIGRPREAVEVLEIATGLFEGDAVQWPVTMELGLAWAAAGETAQATEALEAVLSTLAARGHTDLPPPVAVTLAKLHEAQGNPTRAADLYRALTEGSDGTNHGLYYREAARLLQELGLVEEAARMRQRAAGLPGDPEPPVEGT